jgi:hypothetical protein
LRQQTAARRFADYDISLRIETHNRRAESGAVRPDDTLRLFRLRVEIRDEAIGGAKIDSDDTSHFPIR